MGKIDGDGRFIPKRVPDFGRMSIGSREPKEPGGLMAGVHRRQFLGSLLKLLGLGGILNSFWPLMGEAAPREGPPPELEPWVGRALEYKVSCPLVEDFAQGQIWIQRISSSSNYLIGMKTRLQGIVGVLALQRTDLLASVVQWESAKGRFVPLWHADQVARQGSWRRKVLLFQEGGQAFTEYKLSPEGSRKKHVPAQGKPLDDPLSAFLNWRAGVYGPLRPGQVFFIDNLARRDPMTLRLAVASEEEARSKRPASPAENWTFLLRAELDKEVAESVRGSLEGWLDEQWVVLFAKANNVRLLGEVWARLSGRWRLLEPELKKSPEPPLEKARWEI